MFVLFKMSKDMFSYNSKASHFQIVLCGTVALQIGLHKHCYGPVTGLYGRNSCTYFVSIRKILIRTYTQSNMLSHLVIFDNMA